ncbi:hypothetical protein [Carnobacterium maltaromaticum]|uniref:hypothetical protein n=1 Tax=Carnobacterium maltaromaticum TaxID=2751 RepID=UPI0012FADA33|nr:hypothetical protein [Carnobacterium maltaromaticum]
MKILSVLSERKEELKRVIQKYGWVEDGNDLYMNPTIETYQVELQYLEKFERKVCDLEKVNDIVVFSEWLQKQGKSRFSFLINWKTKEQR